VATPPLNANAGVATEGHPYKLCMIKLTRSLTDSNTIRLWTAFLLVLLLAAQAVALPRSSPEQQGIPSAALLAFIDAADKEIDTMNSFMLVRHGHVVAEAWWAPYDRDTPHILYSLSKSFTSTAVGLAIAEGKLSLDDQVLKFFPEDAPAEPSRNLSAMRVRDLLRMSTGNQTEAAFGVFGPEKTADPWTKIFLAHPVPFKPGTHFVYNSRHFHALGDRAESDRRHNA